MDVEPGERLVEDEQSGSWSSAAASRTRCRMPFEKTDISEPLAR